MNRMTRAVDGMGNVAEYFYNGLGHRTGMRQGVTGYTVTGRNPDFGMDSLLPETPGVWNKETEYILDFTRGFHNLLQKEEDGTIQSYIWDSEAVFMEENGESYSYLNDMQGSVMRLLNHGGESEITYRYDEFGADLTGNQGQFQPFGYTGYQKDMTAGTYYAQAREYDAWSGRFTSEDVVKGNVYLPMTINAYLYCGNAPLKYIDPSGNVYIVAWSYSGEDVEKFEKWYSKKYKINNITIDSDTSDWSNEMWDEWDKRCSFARAANTKVNELIEKGISPDDIVLERIDSADDLTKSWQRWKDYDSVQQMHIYSHGYAGTPEVYRGMDGNISDLEQYPKLNWSADDITFEAASYFYGCHTAEGNNLQTYANNQGVVTFGNRYSASFSSKENRKDRIKTYETDGKVYLGVYGVYTEEGFEFYMQWIFNKFYAERVLMTRFTPEEECIE